MLNDGTLWYVNEVSSVPDLTGRIGIAISNGGSIKASIAEGNTTIDNILTAFPYGNQITIVKLTAQLLYEAIEHGFSLYPTVGEGRFIQVAGIQVVFDPKLDVGSRVMEI
eukprot:Trichotokara_eunicae@DN10131_c0_g1_i1.p1